MGPECSNYSPEEVVMNFRSSWQNQVKVGWKGKAGWWRSVEVTTHQKGILFKRA